MTDRPNDPPRHNGARPAGPPPGDDPGREVDADGGGRPDLTRGRLVGLGIIVAFAVFWVWAFSPFAPRGNPDRLEDRSFAEAAEDRCAVAAEAIEAVPRATSASSPDERAEQLEITNPIIAELVADLGDLAATTVAVDGVDDDAELVDRWLADWEIYLGDRERYLGELRSGDDTNDFRFLLTTINGVPIQERLDGFARANDMESCLTPTDA